MAKVCDKCGVVIRENKDSNVKWPVYSIVRYTGLFYNESVDLCTKCTSKFEEWLKGESDGDKDQT